jgi:hypothetical protein
LSVSKNKLCATLLLLLALAKEDKKASQKEMKR